MSEITENCAEDITSTLDKYGFPATLNFDSDEKINWCLQYSSKLNPRIFLEVVNLGIAVSLNHKLFLETKILSIMCCPSNIDAFRGMNVRT